MMVLQQQNIYLLAELKPLLWLPWLLWDYSHTIILST